MTDNNLGFVSPYLLRPLRSEREAAQELNRCTRCGESIDADCEPDGCRDPECPLL